MGWPLALPFSSLLSLSANAKAGSRRWRILATHDPAFGPLIQQQNRLRQDTAWIYYAMAAISGATLLLSFTRHGKIFIMITVFGTATVFWISVWLHKKECEVYHRNIIRYSPPR
jgi:hypothetical protein